MFDPMVWSQKIGRLVDLIPRAEGEDEHGRIERIARAFQVSRATLYRILKGEDGNGVTLAGWLRVCCMVPRGRRAELREHVEDLVSALGIYCDKDRT